MKSLERALIGAAGLSLAVLVLALPESAKAGAEPYIGDIMAVSYTYCPVGWARAEGQILSIAQNTALFSLIATTYGGNGQTTFALPDLRGRAAMGQGTGPGLSPRAQGQMFGTETQTLTVAQLPSHTHLVNANNLDGDLPGPGGKLLAAAPPSGVGSETIYSDLAANRTMAATMIAPSGGNAPLSTQDPYLTMLYCIALQGVFPSRP